MPLTETQRNSKDCPDCGPGVGLERDLHKANCRRVAREAALQCGPPWNDWPEGPDDPPRVQRP